MVRSILKSKSSNAPASHRSRPSSSSSCPYPFESFPPTPLSPHVHFPPTPTIVSSTHATHSSSIYDRAPIEVSPNSCELPERGGRVYGSPDSVHHASRKPKGSYFHPCAYEVCEREQLFDSPVPIEVPRLIPDTSSSSSCSESDDSDGYGSPQLASPLPHPRFSSRNTFFPPIPATHTQEEINHALSFLPHPPSPVKDRPRLTRRKTPSSSVQTIKSRENHFREPSLDGCLGGF